METASRTLSKPQRLRARRRKQRAVMFAFCLLGASSIIGSLGLISYVDRLAIKDVAVNGAQQLDSASLTASVQTALESTRWKIFANRNIFLYPESDIEKKLASEFPRIKEVELSRPSLLAQAVVVALEEREPNAMWCKGEECFFMDAGGFIFAVQNDFQTPMTPYVFRGGLLPQTDIIGQTFLRGRLPEAFRFMELLKAVGYQPQGITVENEKDFSVPLTDAFTLRVLFDVEGEKIIRDLSLALEADTVRDRVSELEYVDMRFGNRVYYKFKGGGSIEPPEDTSEAPAE